MDTWVYFQILTQFCYTDLYVCPCAHTKSSSSSLHACFVLSFEISPLLGSQISLFFTIVLAFWVLTVFHFNFQNHLGNFCKGILSSDKVILNLCIIQGIAIFTILSPTISESEVLFHFIQTYHFSVFVVSECKFCAIFIVSSSSLFL